MHKVYIVRSIQGRYQARCECGAFNSAPSWLELEEWGKWHALEASTGILHAECATLP